MKHGFLDESRKKLARNAFEKKKRGENEKKIWIDDDNKERGERRI